MPVIPALRRISSPKPGVHTKNLYQKKKKNKIDRQDMRKSKDILLLSVFNIYGELIQRRHCAYSEACQDKHIGDHKMLADTAPKLHCLVMVLSLAMMPVFLTCYSNPE